MEKHSWVSTSQRLPSCLTCVSNNSITVYCPAERLHFGENYRPLPVKLDELAENKDTSAGLQLQRPTLEWSEQGSRSSAISSDSGWRFAKTDNSWPIWVFQLRTRRECSMRRHLFLQWTRFAMVSVHFHLDPFMSVTFALTTSSIPREVPSCSSGREHVNEESREDVQASRLDVARGRQRCCICQSLHSNRR